MEIIKFNFECRIERITDEGFSAVLQDGYLIKFKDSKFRYPFHINDNLNISIENVEKAGREEVKYSQATIYVKLYSFIANGFLFRDVGMEKGFFWNMRGLLTHRKYQTDDIHSENDILKIIIKKVI